MARLYRRDYWARSDVAVQVWVEKRGLAGLLKPVVCNKWGLDLYVAGGQMSETYLYNGGTEIADSGKETFVYAMTDFDPGGKTIFNTLKNGSKEAPGGLSRFTRGVPVHVEQIALTDSQATAWGLPTRPTKTSDTRSAKFIEEHGDRNVELDAIPPAQLIQLVEDAIERHMTDRELEQFKIQETAEKAIVRDMFAGLRQVDEDDDDGN